MLSQYEINVCRKSLNSRTNVPYTLLYKVILPPMSEEYAVAHRDQLIFALNATDTQNMYKCDLYSVTEPVLTKVEP